VKLGAKNVENNRNFTTKLRSAVRFCEMNGCKLKLDFKPEKSKIVLNKWIISELVIASIKTAEALKAYRFNEAAKHLSDFTWDMFCDWYIEFTKPVFMGADQTAIQETRDTAAWVLDQILLLLNPIMPFVTEELHMQLLGKEMSSDKADWLQSKRWPEFDKKIVDQAARDEMNWVVKLISEVRSVRSIMGVPAAEQIKMLLKGTNETSKKRLVTYNDIIRRLARLSEASLSDAAVPKGSVQQVIGEATIILPIADVVDFAQERTRLQKEIEKANANIERINKMLLNQAFLAKAPEEVVQEQTEARTEAENLKAKLSQALKQLEAA